MSILDKNKAIDYKDLDYISQHKSRLSYMPWLYFRLKQKQLHWAKPWQDQLQAELMALETVSIADNCFIAPEAKLFAEPGRLIEIGSGSSIAADCFVHGPVRLGQNVSLNHHCSLDGGSKGIEIGDDCRLAAYTSLYAFNHRLELDRPIHQQGVDSSGIRLGKGVWLGAKVGVVDGVSIGDHAVVGMNALVSKDIPAYAIVAGNPGRPIGDRRGLDQAQLEQLSQSLGI